MTLYHNGYQHMVLDNYASRLREIYARRRARLAAIQTPEQAHAYQREARTAVRRAFTPLAGLPLRTPLNPRIARVAERDAFHIENIIFESRPGFLVTANLYVPHDLQSPAPCVLGSCGHAAEGKAYGLYQEFCQRLALAGFVVLIYDPISQGERDQYHNSGYREEVGWGTRAHNMMGKQLDLLGDSFGFWRAWDGIRALDYLLFRPEVDPSHVGLTGNSGGGTMSTWLWALDDRFTMAAPNCFVTTFLHNLENELPADAEQCPPGVIGAGLDMADFIIAQAPKPVLLLGEKYDFFDRRGLREAYQDIRAFYDVLGAAENAALWIGDQDHGYHVPSQQAMVEFFCRHSPPLISPPQARGTSTPAFRREGTEKKIGALPVESLWATPTGQTNEAGGAPAYELIAAQAYKAAQNQPQAANSTTQLKTRVAELLALPSLRPLPHYRIPRPVRAEGRVYARFAVETENDVRAILRKLLDQQDHPYTLDVEPEVHLYLPHVSAEADLSENEWAISLAVNSAGERRQRPLYALDVRGLGESLPEEEGNGGFFEPYGMDYMFHAYGLMLNQSYLGRRVYDLLCVLDLLVHEGAETIHLYGRGQGAILAVFAALFHDKIASLTLKDVPRSFLEWTQTPYVAWPAANCVPGILHVADLPDLVQSLGSKVTVVSYWGPTMEAED